MSQHKFLDLSALILVIIGGLNWGLVGLFDFDLVAAVFGEFTMISRIIYVLVAISGIYAAIRSPWMAHLRERRSTSPHTPHPAG